jgi:hypothetical protein
MRPTPVSGVAPQSWPAGDVAARMRSIAGLAAALALVLAPAAAAAGPPQDATVIAVIDSGFNPYHWDFSAAHMPQQRDTDPANDLPLDRPADEWLPGFDRSAFASLTPLPLTRDDENDTTTAASLHAQDAKAWAGVNRATAAEPNGHWIPGTKVIGAMQWGSGVLYGGPSAHGTGTTSSAVGNLHGTCPECLVLLIRYTTRADAEAAIEWAERQPWIDAISNSYGFGSNDVYGRDRVYAGSDVELQRTASLRGQTIFFSAGNGIENAFTVPNQTTFSSQEGPDWIVTVGAVSPTTSGPYLGSGKPADIAGVGSGYRNAYGAAGVGRTGTSGFGGTSNATPQIAGLYARTLHLARRVLGGERVQEDGVVAQGEPVACEGCPLQDGRLTAPELRTAVFHGAKNRGALTVSGQVADLAGPRLGEELLLAEGHGSYLGRVKGPQDQGWRAESEQVVLGQLTGAQPAPPRPAGEREWMVVDSYCRQRNWGTWSEGYYRAGETPLPGPSPSAPVRSAREQTCPGGPTGLPRPASR